MFHEAVRGARAPDILQIVVVDGRQIAKMIFELKNTSSFSQRHVRQTIRYQKQLDAEAAILVTTGNAQSFSGFDRRSGVFVVRPAGAVAIAQLCRSFIVERAGLVNGRVEKKRIQKVLYDYVASSECRKRFERIESAINDLIQLLSKEIEFSKKNWSERWGALFALSSNCANLGENLTRILSNEELTPFAPEEPPLLNLQGDSDRNTLLKPPCLPAKARSSHRGLAR